MRITTIQLSELETYIRIIKAEDRLKSNLVWLNKLSEMKLEAMKRIKADSAFLEAHIHGGNTARFMDKRVREKVRMVMLSHIQIDKLRSKLDKELADSLLEEYDEKGSKAGQEG